MKALNEAFDREGASKDNALIVLECERNRCPKILELYDKCEIKYINGVNLTKYSFGEFFRTLTQKQTNKLFSNMTEQGRSMKDEVLINELSTEYSESNSIFDMS